jgi:hypothetical protein
MKKFIMIITLCLFYLAGMAQQAAVDVITLKNGSVIRGKILEQNGQVIKIYTTNRSMVEVKPEEVESMTKESSGTAEQSRTLFDEDAFTEGNMIIGGSGRISYNKVKGATNSTFGVSVNPTFAYFVADGLAIGARLPLSYFTSGGDKSYSFGIGPIIKYYTEYLMVFNLGGAYEFEHYSTGKRGTFSLKPGVGMAFFLSPKVSLEPGIYYEFYSEKWKSSGTGFETKQKVGELGLEVGLTIFL